MISGTNFIQLLFSGLAMGAIYALTAKGLFIAHLATTRMNFGQGEFLMIAAYLSMALILAGVPVVVSTIVVIAFFYWILFRTRQGRAIHAVAFNPEAATLLGVDVRRTVTLVFVLAAVLA